MRRLLPLVLLAALPFSAGAKNDLAKYAGTYKGETRAKGETREQSHDGAFATRHHTITLDLGKDGSATVTQSPDGTSEMTNFAHWTVSGDTVKLIFDAEKGQTPPPMTFRFDHKMLVPMAWNHDLWRTLPPPSLKRVKGSLLTNDM